MIPFLGNTCLTADILVVNIGYLKENLQPAEDLLLLYLVYLCLYCLSMRNIDLQIILVAFTIVIIIDPDINPN